MKFWKNGKFLLEATVTWVDIFGCSTLEATTTTATSAKKTPKNPDAFQ